MHALASDCVARMFKRLARNSRSRSILLLAFVGLWFAGASATSCPAPNDQGNQCPVPGAHVSYSLNGIFNDRAFVNRSGFITGSNNMSSYREAAAEFDVGQAMSQIISCDHSVAIRGHELAWTDQNGLHIQDLSSGTETFSNTSVTANQIVDYSDSYVVIEEIFSCCGGNQDFAVSAISRSTQMVQGIYTWGDGEGRDEPGQFALDGHQLVVIESSGLPIRMRIVDLDSGTSRDIPHQGGQALACFELDGPRFVWGEILGDNQSSLSTTIYAADIPTLNAQVLHSFPNGTDEPFAMSGVYMLVTHIENNVTRYDLWSLSDPPAMLRIVSSDGKPGFIDGFIQLSGPAEGPYTLVDPATGTPTIIQNPFAN